MTIQVHTDAVLTLQQEWSIGGPDHLVCRTKASKSVGCHDECSLDDTLSTTSLSSDDSFPSSQRVSFAEELVTDTWTRPYTEENAIGDLYYTTEETNRFRQEYRMERKLIGSFDPGEDERPLDLERNASSCSKTISRVVVLHNDKLETYTDSSFDTADFWSGSITWW